VRKGSAFPWRPLYVNLFFGWGSASPASMATISKDTPCLSITSVARDRLPIFPTNAIKKIACSALNEARGSGRFAIFAYVIMPNHLRYGWICAKSSGTSPDDLRQGAAMPRKNKGD